MDIHEVRLAPPWVKEDSTIKKPMELLEKFYGEHSFVEQPEQVLITSDKKGLTLKMRWPNGSRVYVLFRHEGKVKCSYMISGSDEAECRAVVRCSDMAYEMFDDDIDRTFP